MALAVLPESPAARTMTISPPMTNIFARPRTESQRTGSLKPRRPMRLKEVPGGGGRRRTLRLLSSDAFPMMTAKTSDASRFRISTPRSSFGEKVAP